MKYINCICSNPCAFKGLKDVMFQAVQTLQFCKTLLAIRKQFLKLLFAFIPLKKEKRIIMTWPCCMCVCPYPFKLWKQLIDFHKTLCEYNAFGGDPPAVFHFSYYVQKKCGRCSYLCSGSFTTATCFQVPKLHMERYAQIGIFVEYNKLFVSYIVIKPKTE
jgi:hypothetical protein